MMGHLSEPATLRCVARTDERDGHEGDPQPSVETDDPLLAVNEQGDPRDRNGVLLCLQP